MARNRVIYQSEAVYVSQDVNATGVATGDRDAAVLDGVQNANYSFSISRQDVNCFGQLASLDRIITETPTVSFDASYYLANFGNENKLGFHIWADPATIYYSATINTNAGYSSGATSMTVDPLPATIPAGTVIICLRSPLYFYIECNSGELSDFDHFLTRFSGIKCF